MIGSSVAATICLLLATIPAWPRPDSVDPQDQVHIRDNGPSGQLDALVDSVVLTRMREHRIQGAAVVVMSRGRMLKSTGYGRATIATGEPATPQTAFFVASIAKAVTAAAVLVLIEAQQLRLHDSVGGILAGLPEAWRGVTIGHLLGMTAGLPDVSPRPGVYFADLPTALDSLRSSPLLGRPGESFHYAQTNFALLGQVLAARTGRPFEAAVDDLLFEPLGIRSALFGDWHDIRSGRAEWYSTLAATGRFSAAHY